jgi:hypothetical protein
MNANGIREEARNLIDQLPDDATWDDLQYLIDVRRSIEAGLADCEAGRLVSTIEVRHLLKIAELPQG